MPKSAEEVLPYPSILLLGLSPKTFFSSDKLKANCQNKLYVQNNWKKINDISMLSPRYFLGCFFLPSSLPFLLQFCKGWAACTHMLMHADTHTHTHRHQHTLTLPHPTWFGHSLYSIFFFLLIQFPFCSVFRPCMPCWCFTPTPSHSPCVIF